MPTTFEYFITPEQLLSCLDTPNVIILDTSIPPVGNTSAPEFSWPQRAIANARRFDLEGDFSDHQSALPHTMPTAETFALQARKLGINQDSQIIVYDDLGIFSSARAWWMFKAMGFNKVAVLDGGLPLWCKKQFPVVTIKEQTITAGDFIARPKAGYFCDHHRVSQALTDKKSAVLDARGAARFFGRVPEPRAGIRSGHMPGAVNLPYTELLTDGQFKSKAALQQKLQALTANKTSLVMSCGSGVTACILALVADYCGYQEISVYDGSWSEWGQKLTLAVTCD